MKKDIDWVIQEIHTTRKVLADSESSGNETADEFTFNNGKEEGLVIALKLLDQLDEPEVLSLEWIDEHSETFKEIEESMVPLDKQYIKKTRNGGIVPKREEITHKKVEKYLLDRNIRVIDIDVYGKMQSDLAEFENKIVIEKPVIPKFVADWIEENRSKYGKDILEIGYDFYETDLDNFEVDDWVGINTETFARAWLDGYEVEEEPIYIIDTDDIEISDGNHYLTNLTLSKDSVKLPIVGDKFDAIRFDDINQAEAIASYVCGRVEELEE